MNLDKYGGKPIGHGGFGCVFRPSLPCNEYKPSNRYISKLMLNNDAQEEYNEIKKYINVLKTIQNNENYFILTNIKICKPLSIPSNQLLGFDEECTSLTKHGINKRNINYQLKKLSMLVMPYGGAPINKFIKKHYSSFSLINLNKSLIELLNKGIIPMNNKHLYHCDLKPSNILVMNDNDKLKSRIIDWGLSVLYKDDKNIPDNLHRSFQFNLPFSIIFFSPTFIEMLQIFLNNNPKPQSYQYREFIINFLNVFLNKRGPGHLQVINRQIFRLYEKEINTEDKTNILKYDFTYYHIIEYLSSILETFTINETFYLEKYFKNVFLKNIDIWGFITCYFPMFELLYFNFGSLTSIDLDLYNNLRYLIIHFLYDYSDKPIPVKELSSFLFNLNPLISKSIIINDSNINVSSSA